MDANTPPVDGPPPLATGSDNPNESPPRHEIAQDASTSAGENPSSPNNAIPSSLEESVSTVQVPLGDDLPMEATPAGDTHKEPVEEDALVTDSTELGPGAIQVQQAKAPASGSEFHPSSRFEESRDEEMMPSLEDIIQRNESSVASGASTRERGTEDEPLFVLDSEDDTEIKSESQDLLDEDVEMVAGLLDNDDDLELVEDDDTQHDADEEDDDDEPNSDSEFDPDDESDSDESAAPVQSGRRGSNSVSASSPLTTQDLAALKKERNALIVREASPGLQPLEVDRLAQLEKLVAEGQRQVDARPGPVEKPKQQKVREKVAKTAREYWQRDLRRQAAKNEEKRKREEQAGGSKKARKTSATSSPTKKTWSSFRTGAEILDSLEDTENNNDDSTSPAIGEVRATTHADQFAQYTQLLSQGFDTRHGKSQHRDLQNAVSSFGYKKLKAINGLWKPKFMLIPLKSHQVVAASWMVEREAKEWKPAGGLLGDEMGVGKTITALACISGHPPEKDDIASFSKATLVIVPSPAVAKQWYDEIQDKCIAKNSKRTAIFSAAYKQPLDRLSDHWVVPSKETIEGLKSKWGGNQVSYEKDLRHHAGDLFLVKWYRIVLDESHMFKNHRTRTAQACWALQAKYRWTLSGTPISNSVDEFFSCLKFIRADFARDLKQFRARYVTGKESKRNFEALISLIMFRRTTDTFYKRQLPKSKNKKQSGKKEEAEPDEPNDANSEAASKIQYARVQKLRQAASHPFNLEKLIQERFRADDIEWMQDQLKDLMEENDTDEQWQDEIHDSPSMSQYSSGFECLRSLGIDWLGDVPDMASLLTLAAHESEVRNVACRLCRKAKPPLGPVRSANCEHVYCGNCLHIAVQSADRSSRCPHPGCRAELGVGKALKTPACINRTVECIDKFKEPGRDSNGTHIARHPRENAFFLATADIDDTKPIKIPPSSKLMAAMAVILTWLKEAPEDKIIGRLLQQAGISFLYYNGKVSLKRKATALDKFKNEKTQQVMLSSIRCGGQSLNLTEANRVIIIDPWWNKTLEEQAFGRVKRIGQKKETHLVRILATGSIDERISMLQEAKDKIVKRALQDDGHKPVVSDALQLRLLFSPLKGEELLKLMAREVLGKGAKA
ncbi:hypothetical protein ACJ41O_011063 [Fusarium nematophilum]